MERGEQWADFIVEDLADHTAEFGLHHEDREAAGGELHGHICVLE